MIEQVESFSLIPPQENTFAFTGENEEGFPTFQNCHTPPAASLSAGSLISLLKSGVSSGFAAIRPCSHHSFREHGGGFCIYNSVMVGIRWWQARNPGKKVCILDWDVHFGDGTAEIVREDPGVLYVSLHRYDEGEFYPGKAGDYRDIGTGEGEGFNVALGFNGAGVTDGEYAHVCEEIAFPII